MERTVVMLLMVGGLLAVVGAIVMVGAWPSSSSYTDIGGEPVVSTEGSRNGAIFGGVVAGVGSIMISIAVVAIGVRIAVADLVRDARLP
jgi:hypothetical protein